MSPSCWAASKRWPVTSSPVAYALLRVVPRVERGERINAAVVLFCRQLGFPGPARRARRAAPGGTGARARAAGAAAAGPVADREPSERFGWIVAPSSTMIQPSAVHTGLVQDPEALLEHLMATLVRAPG